MFGLRVNIPLILEKLFSSLKFFGIVCLLKYILDFRKYFMKNKRPYYLLVNG